jgi:hypothetical protein
MFTKIEIINHLENLIEKLKQDELDEEKLKDLSLLYIRHLYIERKTDDDIKYFALGWYIYEFLLPK